MPLPRGYPPIAAHGAIGNLRTTALVGEDGGIDWCPLPDIDSPGVFSALLDQARGGIFRVRAVPALRSRQEYLRHTNVLRTVHHTRGGTLSITDFMPLDGPLSGTGGEPPAEIVRILEAGTGSVEVELEWAPRFDFARAETRILPAEGGFVAEGPAGRLALAARVAEARIEPGPNGPVVRAGLVLHEGQGLALATRWDRTDTGIDLASAMAARDRTVQAWRGWVQKEEATGARAWAGAWNEEVIRSELVLKLLTYAPTGAMVAAATTSLPEGIGGVRNWDYRYAWIRDAALAAQALFALGHGEEAEAFMAWSERAAAAGEREEGTIRIMYDVRGRRTPPEVELSHLEGYRGSTPVRTGNGAAGQLQLDVYGELISAAYEVHRLGGTLPPDVCDFLPAVAAEALARWQEPDAGIWERRDSPTHYVYSKAMVWMALDRAVRMVSQGAIRGEAGRWRASMEEIRSLVLEQGFDPELGAFTAAFGSGTLDAANLLLPLMELVPFDDPRVQGTIDRTLERLTEGGLVYRYRDDDGLPGEEGAMGLCTFWLVDALALSGRIDEAYGIFDGIVSRAGPLGLFAEQLDPMSGEHLGNFPQAYTHLGLINSALYLAYVEGREIPVPAPIGSDEHRSG